MGKRCACRGVLVGVLVMVAAQGAFGDSAVLEPIKDNTLYESPTGALSNGAGQNLFAGRTSQPFDSRRRAVVSFDVAGNIPAGSMIESVTLTMTASANASGSTNTTLHRLTAAWGEGASDAGSPGGQGTAAAAGDATWLHTSFDTALWKAPGGDLDPTPSASTPVVGTGLVTWFSTPELVDDVQGWLNSPAANFGWILVGDETAGGTSVRFASRESAATQDRPMLVVAFTPQAAIPTVSAWGLTALALSLITVAKIVFRRRSPLTNEG